MKPVVVLEVVSPGCEVCKQVESYWQLIAKDWPNVTFRRVDVVTPEGQELAQKYMIFSSPSIIINEKLWSAGGFNKEKFVKKLKELSYQN